MLRCFTLSFPYTKYSCKSSIDISALISGNSEQRDRHQVAVQIGQACRAFGFFYIVGHSVND
ncbi:hypothetical protein BZZ01_17570 [Nostocales cyanobacterium HT-58-2]|nr:hypothetical protein BZZ01_17570 [Nostocales cyanobacterium HT-58-2]